MRGEFQRLGDDVLLLPPPPPRARCPRVRTMGEWGEGVLFLRRYDCGWNMSDNTFSIYGLVRIRIQASRCGLLRSCWGRVGGIIPDS